MNYIETITELEQVKVRIADAFKEELKIRFPNVEYIDVSGHMGLPSITVSNEFVTGRLDYTNRISVLCRNGFSSEDPMWGEKFNEMYNIMQEIKHTKSKEYVCSN